MPRQILVVGAVLALILALGGCYSGSRPARIGRDAPDFVVQDGPQKLALHDFKGQVVVLNFWATWCPPCIEEMPSLISMQSRLKSQGIAVLAVSVDVDQKAYEKFLRDHQVSLMAIRDARQESNSLYGTYKFPETYIIDRKGVLRRKFIGPVDWNSPDIVQYLTSL